MSAERSNTPQQEIDPTVPIPVVNNTEVHERQSPSDTQEPDYSSMFNSLSKGSSWVVQDPADPSNTIKYKVTGVESRHARGSDPEKTLVVTRHIHSPLEGKLRPRRVRRLQQTQKRVPMTGDSFKRLMEAGAEVQRRRQGIAHPLGEAAVASAVAEDTRNTQTSQDAPTPNDSPVTRRPIADRMGGIANTHPTPEAKDSERKAAVPPTAFAALEAAKSPLLIEAADQTKDQSYETSYIKALEGLRASVRDGKANVATALDSLESTNDSLKSEIIGDLQGADLIADDGEVVGSEVEMRIEQNLEFIDAIKHETDLVGTQYTARNGALLEIIEQDTDDEDEVSYKIRSTVTRDTGGKQHRIVSARWATGRELTEFLKTN